MSGNSLLLDSNIILYLLKGEETLIPLLEKKNLYVSVITEIELLSFPEITEGDQKTIYGFLNECHIVDLSFEIKKKTIQLRRQYRLKLPDAIIAATCYYLNAPMVSADSAFKKIKEIDLFFYEN